MESKSVFLDEFRGVLRRSAQHAAVDGWRPVPGLVAATPEVPGAT